MRRKVLAILAAAVVLAAVGALALVARGGPEPAEKPFRADPAKQYGDDADLMRRLERKKLVESGKR